MALRLSPLLLNYANSTGSVRRALTGGRIKIYTGTQPANPTLAPTGTLLVTITQNSGAYTAETRSTGTFTLTGGASGNVSVVTVNAGPNLLGATVNFNTSLTQTATDIAAAINNYVGPGSYYTASASGAVITLTADLNRGTTDNTFAIAVTAATITTSTSAFAGGVASVAGLRLGFGSNATFNTQTSVIATGDVWSGVVATGGTAGWFRFSGPTNDADGVDSTNTLVRLDGSVATSGGDLNLASTTLVASATQTITQFTINTPAQ